MGTILDVQGVSLGHYTNQQEGTGCTVILCPDGAIAGVDIRGPVLGTHEIDLVRSGQLVKRVNAVLLTGGSSFGLEAVQGVMRYLEERKWGFKLAGFVVPIVTAASLFDLEVARTRPRRDAGYQACVAASDKYAEVGAVGAGTGALVGKVFGAEYASKGGVGTASERINDNVVGVLAVVNCFGCVVDPDTQQPIAGPSDPGTGRLRCDLDEIMSHEIEPQPWANNLLAVVATDLLLTKEQASELARIAYHGFTRVVRPANPAFDSSVVFSLSTAPDAAEEPSRMLLGRLSSLTTELIAEVTLRAVTAAANERESV